MMSAILMFLLVVVALFLILLILIQRGRGGGLAGAFGGMGGQSAFGTKAGDLFTKITVGVAFFWIVLCTATDKMLTGTGEASRRAGGPVPVRGAGMPTEPRPASGTGN